MPRNTYELVNIKSCEDFVEGFTFAMAWRKRSLSLS